MGFTAEGGASAALCIFIFSKQIKLLSNGNRSSKDKKNNS